MPRALAPTIAPDYRLSDAPRHTSIGTIANESIVPLMTNTWADRFQHATIQAAEYWTGSAWTAFPSIDTVKQVFSGYPATGGASLNSTTYPKWRVSFSGTFASYAAMLQIYQEYGPPKGFKVTLEESSDNVAWTTLLAETTVADGIYYSLIPTGISYGAYVRVTIEHLTAGHAYQWQQVRFLTDRCGAAGGQALGLPFIWNYDKGVTFGGATLAATVASVGVITANSGGASSLRLNSNVLDAVGTDANHIIYLRSKGSGGVHINVHANSGTGGFTVGNGAASPATVFSVTAAGLVTATTGFVVGATPASYGGVRLTNGQRINWRNAANTADAGQVMCQADDNLWVNPETGRGGYLSIGGTAVLGWHGAGVTLLDNMHLYVGTTTGSKIGTGTTQKLGFWNATPVVQNTGWTATAGYTALRSFNPQTTTLAETARVLGTLVDTLKSYGLLG